MFHFDNKRHNKPHIHIEYLDETAVIDIETGELLAGKFPANKLKLVQAWVEIHQVADWKLAVEGKEVFKINPLQ